LAIHPSGTFDYVGTVGAASAFPWTVELRTTRQPDTRPSMGWTPSAPGRRGSGNDAVGEAFMPTTFAVVLAMAVSLREP
jgi:hypothetical protein